LLLDIERSAGDLFSLHQATADLPPYPTTLEDFYEAQADEHLWVAVDSRDTPVGFALVEMLGGCAHLEELDVYPEHGRRGLGTRLVQTVCEWARSRGIEAVTLTTFRDIPWNAPFYEKFGFRVVPFEELTPELLERVEWEERAGLPREIRVAMRYDTKTC
jgi:GNAT superfamily N-acetyltransferase